MTWQVSFTHGTAGYNPLYGEWSYESSSICQERVSHFNPGDLESWISEQDSRTSGKLVLVDNLRTRHKPSTVAGRKRSRICLQMVLEQAERFKCFRSLP